MTNQLKNVRKDNNLYILIFFLVVIRFLISYKLNPIIYGYAVHDDYWMINAAKNILNGEWLGVYNQYTLIKGAFSPMFVAFAYIIGIDFMRLQTIMYIFSSLVFLYAINPLIKRKWIKIMILIIIMFNPISFSSLTFQRIYRNGFSQWQILLLFSSYFSIYLYRLSNWKTIWKWTLLAGLSLFSLVNTREDIQWVMIFVITATLVTIVSYGYSVKFKSILFKKTLIFLIPFFIMFLGNTFIKYLNYENYGIYTLNDRTSGYFAEVIKELYNIEQDISELEKYTLNYKQGFYINILQSTLEKAYQYSPTLSSIKNEISESVLNWDSIDSINNHDGELELDHFIFALRDAVSNAGYYNDGQSTELFYKEIYSELKIAFDSELLSKRGIAISGGSVPLQTSMAKDIIYEILNSINYIITWNDVSSNLGESLGNINSIELFENITGDYAANAINNNFTITGWAFLKNNEDILKIIVTDMNDKIIKEVQLIESQDVYNYFLSNGNIYNNSYLSRFSISSLDIGQNDDVILNFYNDNNVIAKILFNSNGKEILLNSNDLIFNIETFQIHNNEFSTLKYFYRDRANLITSCYQKFSKILFVLGCFSFLYLLFKAINRKQDTLCTQVLFLISILLTYFLFVIGISYITVSTFWARNYLYLSSAYILYLLFISLSIGFFIDYLLNLSKKV